MKIKITEINNSNTNAPCIKAHISQHNNNIRHESTQLVFHELS